MPDRAAILVLSRLTDVGAATRSHEVLASAAPILDTRSQRQKQRRRKARIGQAASVLRK
jgi:hypothetical protein